MADTLLTGTTLIEDKRNEATSTPIGSIIAWLKSFTNTPSIPSGWVECDGSVLSDADSVYNGATLPDLNGGEFLRGDTTSGGTGGSSTHSLSVAELASHQHGMTAMDGATNHSVYLGIGSSPNIAEDSGGNAGSGIMQTGLTGSGTAHENKPPYHNVVWIMKIK